MRIILATPIYPPEIGGPATYARELGERLKLVHTITIVTYADEVEAIEGVKILSVSKKSSLPIRLIRYFFILLREAKRVDIIYVQNAVAAGLPAVLVGMLRRKPVVLKFVGDEAWERATQAGLTNKSLDEFLSRPPVNFKIGAFIDIQRFVLRRADKVMPPSKFLRLILATHYGVEGQRLEVNYNAFEGAPSAQVQARKPHQILTVARLVNWKGVDGILRAAAILKEKFPDMKLVVAGDGPEMETLQVLARTLRIGDVVEFLGRVSRQEVARLEAESGILVLNSSYEGLPHIALEAFAACTPIVATNIPGTSEVVLNEQTGLLVPLHDDAKLADAIERLFKDENLRTNLTEGGAAALTKTFSWESHIENLLAVFTLLKQS